MNTLKKILVTVTMVVTLGATTSCGNGNKDDEPTFVGGLPYTLVLFSRLKPGIEYKVKFECEGDPEVYWNSETPNHEKEHTFLFNSNNPGLKLTVLIKGNIDNLQFCDSSGNLLANGNAKISTIIFSNTITKLPEYACYSLDFASAKHTNDADDYHIVYLPASIKTIGKNAFFPCDVENLENFICEPPFRPSTWDPNWCTVGEFARFMSWGLCYYITENYDMYYIVNDDPIHTACYGGTLKYDVTDLVIPETINVNNFECPVVSIASIGNSKETLESITIPKSVTIIDTLIYGYNDRTHNGVFEGCSNLKAVNFAVECEFLWIGHHTFCDCSSLTNITLPKGLINLSAYMFEDCTNLTSVVIPDTVRTIGANAFWNCEKLTNVTFADEYEYLWIDEGNTFESCSLLTSITLPRGLINIPSYMFDGCTNLTSVTIPNTVKTVNNLIFRFVEGDSQKQLTIDLTGYTNSDQIATCDVDLLTNCEADTVTFKTNHELKEEDFIEKDWPETSEKAALHPKIVWDDGSTLNA